MIKLYNSQSRSLEEFIPRDPNRITMYVCGPTVYSSAHIGNARPAIVFDQLFRLLRAQYGEQVVKYARNVTDVDDKIIDAARTQGVEIREITEPALAAYHTDLAALGNLEPTFEPKATESIQAMLFLIKRLVGYKHAYVRKGEVFFHVPSNPHAGLANHTDLQSGGRVAVDTKKKDPRDFVLWKPAKPGEPFWSSPWGNGRPGWHIECSAMIAKVLGEQTIDIHGGGQDLRFPHHEAENAQSCCAFDIPKLANYWLHNGLLTVNGDKMSKSQGNVIYLKDLLEKYPGESVRYFFLQSHYRSPLDFTHEKLEAAHRALTSLYDALYECDDVNYSEDINYSSDILDPLKLDLNTPMALTVLHQMAKTLLYTKSSRDKAIFIKSAQLLGFFQYTASQWRSLGVDKDAIELLISQRRQARLDRDFQKADEIRQQLFDMGILLADGIHGTEWRKI